MPTSKCDLSFFNHLKALKMVVLRLYEDEVLQTHGNTEIRLSRSPESTVSELIIRQIHSNRSIIYDFILNCKYKEEQEFNNFLLILGL